MIESNRACEACPNKHSCHPALRPERFRHSLTGRKIIPLTRLENHRPCRHFSCSDGVWAKAGAQSNMQQSGGEVYTVIELDWSSHEVEAVEFHTGDKPTTGEYARIVTTYGKTYSKQDGVFYPTGQ